MKTHADSLSGITVDDVSLYYCALDADRNSQRQCTPDRNIRFSAQINSTQAQISCARHAGRFTPVEIDIDDEGGAIELAPLVASHLIAFKFFGHGPLPFSLRN